MKWITAPLLSAAERGRRGHRRRAVPGRGGARTLQPGRLARRRPAAVTGGGRAPQACWARHPEWRSRPGDDRRLGMLTGRLPTCEVKKA
jgi:hypothetical protein